MKIIYVNTPKYGVKEIFVDDDDYDIQNAFKWLVRKHRNTFYAARTEWMGMGQRVLRFNMHRCVMKVSDPSKIVDHIDHNGLNNQKSNLRIATHSQNKQNVNSKKNSLVRYNGNPYKWRSAIRVNGADIVKDFPCTKEGEILAAKLHDELAKHHYGQFANLNFK